ncbi:MAG TPA: alpha/beta hydrolase-fold protein [Vicinamibacterales bacterium]|nr:alpha/beta hydrolase-fold protein [Vicinamibacterales bacterium]
MLRLKLLAIGLTLAIVLVPWQVQGMERGEMDRLLAMARTQPNSPDFRAALIKRLGEAPIKSGEAFDSNGPDFIWAVESASQPSMILDDQPAGPLRQIAGTNLWFHVAQLRVGTSHRFHYLVNGAKFGGSYDVPAYTPDSYARPGVPQGKISEKLVHTSKLYGGMETNYWIYVPAQYNPAVPAALMVWQDGERYMTRNVEESCRLCPSLYRLQEVTDNLIHDKKIPVMIHVFVSPGTLNGKPLRSILYDTVSDKYGQFLLEELLPEVYAKYNIRKDAYSRAIQGQSSGGIAAFTVAFNHPESFSRVYTVVGSFTALQWKPGEVDGGNIYPFKVRREPKRNLRVWMNDGSEDQEANSGSWPLQNIQLANSLKLKGYDFHFSFGGGTHHAALAASELPQCLTWLWRDYDPARTEQVFEQSAEEQSKPPFRVRIYNR